MATDVRIYKLQGKVQHYSWGGYQFIPELLRMKNDDQKPFAEYWLGAHPNHPGMLQLDGSEVALNAFIEQDKQKALGTTVVNSFGSLPFLLKILDVRQMLSIQVHPSKAAAELGYEEENKKGIAVNASNRNYKDDNHKPELLVALSDFWLLHGFKPADQLKEVLSADPELAFLVDEFDNSGYKGLYEKVMLMEQAEVNRILEPVISRIMPLYENGELLKKQEDFWAARAVEAFCKDGNYDRGIFSIYFFNLLHLKEGQGIYQPAQLPHAYLEGQNVEIMANSDNVLRAGLTDKYIDVAELLKHVRFEETVPNILGSDQREKGEMHFATPAPEFEIVQYDLDEGDVEQLHAESAEIILVLRGGINIEAGEKTLKVAHGEAAFVLAETAYRLEAMSAAEVFRARVPKK